MDSDQLRQRCVAYQEIVDPAKLVEIARALEMLLRSMNVNTLVLQQITDINNTLGGSLRGSRTK